MIVRMISKSGNVPAYATEGSSGMDLRAWLEEPVVLRPMERTLIPTGLYAEIPEGYEGQIRARSGLAIRKGIGLVNSVGTIDSDYRGEIRIPVINFGQEDAVIENGDRIAQLVFARYEKAEIVLAEALSDSERGAGGFGHTGVNE